MDQIRTAIIGMGYRGKQLYGLLKCMPGFDIIAVADPVLSLWSDIPCYNKGNDDYLRMLDQQQPELVIIASPWRCHVEHALRCAEHGCKVALEIKGGLAEDEYRSLMVYSEAHSCRIYPLENTLFMREILSLYNLIKQGILGEIVYMRGGYRHDLRDILLDDAGRLGNRKHTESVWRSKFYQEENGDLYPTHGLAPLCMLAGIGTADTIQAVTSFASKAVGIHSRISCLGGDTSVKITQGDVVVTQLETVGGVLLSLTHDTTLPRPKSLDFEVQGTHGIWQGDGRRIYIEGISPRETWESDEAYVARYLHPYWQRWGREALQIDTHHNGMDYIMLKALEEDCNGGMSYPATLSDLALWTSVTPWSQRSIAEHRTINILQYGQ